MFPFETKVNWITGINGKGVSLKKPDLDMLLYLYHQRTLSTEQLYRFYSLNKQINPRRLSDKLLKFEKQGLVLKNPHYLHKRSGIRVNVFRISAAGIDLLCHFGLVSDGETPPHLYRNLDHALGVQHVLLDALECEWARADFFLGGGGEHMFTFNKGDSPCPIGEKLNITLYPNKSLNLIEKPIDIMAIEQLSQIFAAMNENTERKNKLISYFPADFPFYKSDKDTYLLLSDWTFSMNEHVFHIEIDGGTEQVSKGNSVTSIEGKFQNYISLAKAHPDLKHHVLFISLDDSVTFLRKHYGRRTVRIANLKREISQIEGVFQSNLSSYIIRLEGSKEMWPYLLQKADGSYDEKRNLTIFHNSLHLNINFFPFSITLVNQKEGMKKHIPAPNSFNYPIEEMFMLKRRSEKFSTEALEWLFLPVIMIEGDLYCHELVTYYSERIEEGDLPPNTKVIAIYESKKGMTDDVFRPDTIYEHVLLVNIEEIQHFRTPAKFYSSKEKEVFFFE